MLEIDPISRTMIWSHFVAIGGHLPEVLSMTESETSQGSPSRFRLPPKPPHVYKLYRDWFGHLVDKDIRLLELGVYDGDSLLLFRDYFTNGIMVGLDMNPVHIADPTNRIHLYQGYQQDTALLDLIAGQEAPEGFDIVIDDCSHIGQLTRVSFWHLFQYHLKPGGIYAIEDVNTAYMAEWPDGHRYSSTPRTRKALGRSAKIPTGWHARRLSVMSRAIALARRLLPKQATQFLLRSDRIRGLPSAVADKRYGYSKKLPSHMYGMVGFAKQLMDVCCLGDKSGNNMIAQMHVYQNLIVLVKSGKTG